MDFTYKEVIPACFIVPVQAFDMEDAQSFLVIIIKGRERERGGGERGGGRKGGSDTIYSTQYKM